MADANKNALKVFNPSCARHVPAIAQPYDYDYKTWLPLQVNSSICWSIATTLFSWEVYIEREMAYINQMILVYVLRDQYEGPWGPCTLLQLLREPSNDIYYSHHPTINDVLGLS
jgi:hypothetical protein